MRWLRPIVALAGTALFLVAPAGAALAGTALDIATLVETTLAGTALETAAPAAPIQSALDFTALVETTLAGALAQPLDVRVEPSTVDTDIGTEVPLTMSITNVGANPTGPLVAHLVVVDPAGGGSADAEDWTSTLNRPLSGLRPGETRTIAWDVAPVVAGEYRVLVSIVPVGDGQPAVSTQVRFAVSRPGTLVSGATVPVAVAMPVLLVVTAMCTGWAERRLARRHVHAS